MKKLTTLFAVLLFMTISANVMAQNTATATSDASATIILPISITNSRPLNFGTIASTPVAGWVTINASSSLVTSQFNNQLTTLSVPTTAAFTVIGESGSLYSISLPTNDDVILEGDGDDMTVTNFTTSLTGSLNNLTLESGTQEFSVGATLNVNAEQEAGVYNGTFDVTVAYN